MSENISPVIVAAVVTRGIIQTSLINSKAKRRKSTL
jgi:hypothetical protein